MYNYFIDSYSILFYISVLGVTKTCYFFFGPSKTTDYSATVSHLHC